MEYPDDTMQPKADFAKAKRDVKQGMADVSQTATEALHDASDTIKQKAEGYLADATDALSEKAEGVQQDISSNLSVLAGAMRAASEHLANSSQRDVSKFVMDAAGGVERLSSSLKTKPFTEVVSEIRSFGRENSAALIAGSVLAGLALGRFLKSSPPEAGPDAPDSDWSPPFEGSELSEARTEEHMRERSYE